MIKLVKNPQGEVVAFGSGEGYEPNVPDGHTLEMVESYTPSPTFDDVRHALQAAIDLKAQALGFSSGNALMLYAGFINPFKTLAQGFAQWEASVWVEAGQYKEEVIAGTKPMLSPSEAVSLMPTYQ